MEKDKEAFLQALKEHEGKLDERAIGNRLGFSKAYTDELLAALLADEKIEYSTDGTSNYRVKD